VGAHTSAVELRRRTKPANLADKAALPIERTGSAAIFEQKARELIERLERDPSETGRAMVTEARELCAVFQQWLDIRPTDEERITRIQQLFALNRRVMDYLAAQRPSSPSKVRR
jgi:hypothetical protein